MLQPGEKTKCSCFTLSSTPTTNFLYVFPCSSSCTSSPAMHEQKFSHVSSFPSISFRSSVLCARPPTSFTHLNKFSSTSVEVSELTSEEACTGSLRRPRRSRPCRTVHWNIKHTRTARFAQKKVIFPALFVCLKLRALRVTFRVRWLFPSAPSSRHRRLHTFRGDARTICTTTSCVSLIRVYTCNVTRRRTKIIIIPTTPPLLLSSTSSSFFFSLLFTLLLYRIILYRGGRRIG